MSPAGAEPLLAMSTTERKAHRLLAAELAVSDDALARLIARARSADAFLQSRRGGSVAPATEERVVAYFGRGTTRLALREARRIVHGPLDSRPCVAYCVGMNTTAARAVSETGFASVGYVQAGRQNAKHFFATVGSHVVYVNAQDGTRETATKIALRVDRLVARWRACAR